MVALGWKIIFAFCPPVHLGGGWPAFWGSLAMIGMMTAVIGDVATMLGCVIGLKDSVTAITIVALGTSLPDTFASASAALESADNAIGNITGSNAVNVFLGLGLPWVISAVYYESQGAVFQQAAGALPTSVLTFTICAVVCIGTLWVRRGWGGELGGPAGNKWPTAYFFLLLWFVYVAVSVAVAYGWISGVAV